MPVSDELIVAKLLRVVTMQLQAAFTEKCSNVVSIKLVWKQLKTQSLLNLSQHLGKLIIACMIVIQSNQIIVMAHTYV